MSSSSNDGVHNRFRRVIRHGKSCRGMATKGTNSGYAQKQRQRLKGLATKPWAKTRASPQGVAARTGADFVARLANIDILAAPRFASPPILAATHACFA